MPTILQHLLPFVSPHLARKLIIDPDWEKHADIEVIPGALLFADISGFTPLTEALGEAGKEGPEELTRLLNTYFNRLIDVLHAESGEVVKFSGDALMALFACDDQPMGEAIRRAWQAAESIQSMIAEMGELKTSAGALSLQMKIGIGCGDLLAMEVGGLLGRWEYVVAGDPVSQAALAESQANPGDVVLSPEAEAQIHPDPLEPRHLETMATPIMDNMDRIERALRRFVPGAVVGWLETGSTWLGVLRPMTVLFIGLKDYDFAAEGARNTFDDLVKNVQKTLYRFEGSLNKVGVDDKGTVIMALFGAPPLAHEDDAQRGLKAALEVQELGRRVDLPLAVGVTTGQVFAGPVGSERRFEYTVMGDSVNVAARLMKAAGPGNILCDGPTYRAAVNEIKLTPLEPIELKGKTGKTEVFRPDDVSLTSKIVSGSFRPPPMMVGRFEEGELIGRTLSALRHGQGSVLLIEGGAGVGKSRLLKEIEMQAKVQGLPCFRGSGRGTDRTAQFLAWEDVFESFFGLDRDASPEDRLSQVIDALAELAPEVARNPGLLKDWLNLGTQSLGSTQEIALVDPEQRDFSLLQLLASLIRAWTDSRPLIVLLDGGQWLDLWSWKLVARLGELIAETPQPLLVAVALRPMDREADTSQVLERLRHAAAITMLGLKPLSRDEITEMIANRLQVPLERVPMRLAQFIFQRSEGTPFVAEELLRAMNDQGMIEIWRDDGGNNHCRLRGQITDHSESLPGSVRGLILARIDRLSANQQMTLKLASIFGRRFSFEALSSILRAEQGFEPEEVQRHLDSFADMDLVEIETEDPDLIYRFRHRVTQEVAYDSMLFSHRRRLHEAVAQWFENRYGGRRMDTGAIATLCPETSALTPFLADLARHYRAAGNRDRELLYTVLAGRRAALLFQNEEAIRCFGRALDLLPEDAWRDRFEVLKERELIYRLTASRGERKSDLQAMQVCARELNDNRLKGEVAMLQAIYQYNYGRARSAERLARSAIELAQAAESASVEARSRRWLGATLQSLGRHQDAREQMEQALSMAHEQQDRMLETSITGELARFAEKRGDFTVCLDFCDQALALAREEGDLANEAKILRRMASARLARGEFSESAELAGQAEAIQRQIGDRRQEAVTLDLKGRIAMASGDYATARAQFERGLGIRQLIEDRAGQNRSLMLLGDASVKLGQFEKARLCYQQALGDAEDMGMVYGRAEVNARLVALEHAVGDNEKAKSHGLEAARSLSQLNDLPLLAATLTHLGHALGELGECDSAAAAYGNAIRIRTHLGQRSLLMETVAGQALLDFKRGRIDEALEKVNEVLAHFEDRPLSGTQQPFRIYQTCFEVLDHQQDPRAESILQRAHEELETCSAAISEPLLRESFRQSVMENRAIDYYFGGWARQRGRTA